MKKNLDKLVLLIFMMMMGMSGQAQKLEIIPVDAFVPLSENQAPGYWYIDRFAPAAFEQYLFGAENVLKHSIDGIADGANNRPSGFGSSFYNTQGRKYDLGVGVTKLYADIYLPISFETAHRRAGLWGTAYDVDGIISAYPILSFRNIDSSSPKFSYYSSALGDWVDLGTSITYDEWYSLEIVMDSYNQEYRFYINGALVGTDAASFNGSSYFGNMILQAYNFNDPALPGPQQSSDSYDVYWDNIGSLSTIHNITMDTYHGTLQDAINAADPGDEIEMGNNHYPVTSTIDVNKSVTITGESMAGVILDASDMTPITNRVIETDADDITMTNLTIIPITDPNPLASNNMGYTIKAGSNSTPDIDANLTLANITIDGAAERTPFDFHGIDGVDLTNLNASGTTRGNGIQFTGCTDVTLNSFTGTGNAWGSVAIYASRVVPVGGRGSDNVTITGSGLSIDGAVYSQDDFTAPGGPLYNTNVSVTGWDYLVFNDDHRAGTEGEEYTFFVEDYTDATALGEYLNTLEGGNTASAIQKVSDGEWYVPSSLSIQAAIDEADPGDVVNVDAGSYEEAVIVDKSITLSGDGCGSTIIEGNSTALFGIKVNASVTDVTIESLTVQNTVGGSNDAGIRVLTNCDDLAILNVCVVDAAGRGGIYVDGPVDGVTIDNCEVSGAGTNGRGIVVWNGFKENITITNNNVHDISGCCGIELQDGDASAVTMSDNTVTDVGDSGMAAVGLNGNTGPNVLDGNMITNTGRFGMEIKNPDGATTVSNNNVSLTAPNGDLRDRAGIAVFRRGVLGANVDIPNGVTVTGNVVGGFVQASTSEGFGIVVEGTDHTVTGNTVESCDVGILQQMNPDGYPGDANQNNVADEYFGRGNAPTTCKNTISGNTFFSNGLDYRNKGASGLVTNLTSMTTYCSIQEAVDDATAGDIIDVDEGTYVENVVTTIPLTIQGHGPSTIIQPASGVGVALAAGTGPSERSILKDLTIQNVSTGITAGGYTTIDGVTSTGHSTYGINLSNGQDLIITDSHFDDNGSGMKIGSTVSFDGMVITGSSFDNNTSHGWYSDANSGLEPSMDDIAISGTSFSGNGLKGMYTERLSNAVFDGLTVDDNGEQAAYAFGAGLDINLKWAAFADITIENSSFSSNANGSTNGAAVTIKARDDAPSYSGNPASLDNVVFSNNTLSGNERGFVTGEPGKNNAGPTNVVVSDNQFTTSTIFELVNYSTASVAATCNWWGSADPVTVDGKILETGMVDWSPFNTAPAGPCDGEAPVTNVTQNTLYGSIQSAVDNADDGDILEVIDGTFTEQVVINTPNLTIRGNNDGICAGVDPGARNDETIIDGGFYIQGGGGGTILDGLTIINGYTTGGHQTGVVVTPDDVAIQNCIITDCTGSQAQAIETVSGADNLSITCNEITDNWRGIYLNPADGGSITDNNIHANNGVGVGIGSDGQSNLNIDHNYITDHTLEGWGSSAVGANVSAENNRFTNNGVSVAHYGGSAITATCNWWGSADPGVVAASVSGNVINDPWLITNNIDVPVCTGTNCNLAAPTGYSETFNWGVNPATATIAWTPVNGAVSYDILINVNNGGFVQTSGLTVASHTITIPIGAFVQYRVRANCVNGSNSAYTNPARTFTFTTPCISATPSGFNTSNPNYATGEITLGWNNVVNNAGYQLNYSINNVAQPAVVLAQDVNSYLLTGLQIGDLVSWSVKAKCEGLQYSSQGNATPFTFTTVCIANAPVGLTPTNNNFVPIGTVTLQWTSVVGAGSYEIVWQINGGSDQNGNSPTNSFDLPALTDGDYVTWKVRSVCEDGVYSPYSATASFQYGTVCNAAKVLLIPEDPNDRVYAGATGSALLKWNAKPGAVSYELWNSKTNTVINVGNVLEYTLTSISVGSTISWNVRAVCYYGGKSPWLTAENESFYFDYVPPCNSGKVVLIPEDSNDRVYNGATGSALLKWNPRDGAATYELWNSKTNVTINVGNVTQFELTNISIGTTIFWNVRAVCYYGGKSPWLTSENESFYFDYLPPCNSGKVVLIPENNVDRTFSGATGSTVLKWNAREGVASYEFWNSKTNVTINVGNVLEYTLTNIPVGTTVFWNVRAVCFAGGKSPWLTAENESFYFDYSPQCNSSKVVLIPEDPMDRDFSGTNQGNPFGATTLKWNSHLGAASYELWNSVTNLTINVGNVTSYVLASIPVGGTVSWNVRAVCYFGGKSPWLTSENEQFVFEYDPPCSVSSPASLIFTNLPAGGLNIDWDAVVGAYDYEVEYRINGGSWVNDNTTFELNAYALGGLTVGDEVEFKVRAKCIGNFVSPWTTGTHFYALPFNGSNETSKVAADTKGSTNTNGSVSKPNASDQDDVDVRVYPNPSQSDGWLTLTSTQPDRLIYSVEIFDAMGTKGTVVRWDVLQEGQSIVKLPLAQYNVRPGVYFIRVNMGTDTMVIKRIVIL